MLDMELPWWEFIVRAAVVYGALLVMVRISGKRSVGQFTPFDLLVVLLLSEAVSNGLSGGDNSLVGGLIIAATLILLNLAIGIATSRSPRIERMIEGAPVLLGRNGQVYEHALRAHRVGRADVERALRSADCALQDMRCVFLESDGSISVLQKKETR
ncbi:MAG: YetF domain-containing protein [Pseudomonadota bacterium]